MYLYILKIKKKKLMVLKANKISKLLIFVSVKFFQFRSISNLSKICSRIIIFKVPNTDDQDD